MLERIDQEQALKNAAGVANRSTRGRLRFRGSDVRPFLQRMLTNVIETLPAGAGVRAELLDIKGKVISDLRLYDEGDGFIADVESQFIEQTIQKLSMFVLRDDVQITNVSESVGHLIVSGPSSGVLLSQLTNSSLSSLELYAALRISIGGVGVLAARSDWTTSQSYDLFFDVAETAVVARALAAEGVMEIESAPMEVARIEAGVARHGFELTDDFLPIEVGLFGKAIVEKGCYPGQEVIIRIMHRGKTTRTLVGVKARVPKLQVGDEAKVEGKVVGTVTSVAYSHRAHGFVALGVLKKGFADAGTQIDLPTGEAQVVDLPMI